MDVDGTNGAVDLLLDVDNQYACTDNSATPVYENFEGSGTFGNADVSYLKERHTDQISENFEDFVNDNNAGFNKSGADTVTITTTSDERPNDNVDSSVSGCTSDSPTAARFDTPYIAGETGQLQHSTAVASEPDVAAVTAASGATPAAEVHNSESEELACSLEDQPVVGVSSDTDDRVGSETRISGTEPFDDGYGDRKADVYNPVTVGYGGGFSSADAAAAATDVLLTNNDEFHGDTVAIEPLVDQLSSVAGFEADQQAPASLIVVEEGSIISAESQQTATVQSEDVEQQATQSYDVVVAAVGFGGSTAVTPMDEYRHLLRQQEGASATDGEVPTAVASAEFVGQVTSYMEDSQSVAVGHTEASQQSDVISLSSSSAAETGSPMAQGAAARPPSYADGFVEDPQQQLQQSTIESAFLRQQEQTKSTNTWSVTTSAPTPEISAVSEMAPAEQTVSSPSASSAATNFNEQSTEESASQSSAERQQQETRQQRPPLLPLTIRTEEIHQSWATDADTRDQIDRISDNVSQTSGISPSSSAVIVNRQPVEKVAPPEIAKSVRRMFESGEIADRHQVPKRIVRIEDEIAAAESGVFESQPATVDDNVVRDTGEYVSPRAEVQQGLTKSLLSQWQAKGTEEFKVEKQPIVVAEAEGVVIENQPAPQRPDVVRQDNQDPAAELPTPGQARLLRERFANRDDQPTPKKDAKAAVLAEVAAAAESGAPSVIENVPDRRPDVAREEDAVEEVWLRKGYTRDLAGFWSSPQQSSSSAAPRAPIQLPKDTAAPSVFENEPRPLDETVVRGGEYVEEAISVEKGRAKSMVGKWQNMAADKPVKPRAEPIRLEEEADRNAGGVYENVPVALEGVVRSTDQVEDVMGQRGLIRNIAGRFAGRPDGDELTPGLARGRSGVSPRRGPVPDKVVIERADGPAVLENEPAPLRPDVVRSDASDYVDGPKVEPGTTRNLVACWKNKEIENSSPQISARQLELDLARDAGVYENQPEVRSDVIRANDDEPEMIPVAQLRSTRALWNQKEQEEQQQSGARFGKKMPPEPVRFTPPRELTPPRVVQEDYRSYQSITLSSASSTPGRLSPGVGQQHQPTSPGTRQPLQNGVAVNGSPTSQQQQQEQSQSATMTSSAVLVFK